jgi:hypothetical protein
MMYVYAASGGGSGRARLVSFKPTEDARLELSFGGLQVSSCTVMQPVSDEVSCRWVLLIGVLRMFENYPRDVVSPCNSITGLRE